MFDEEKIIAAWNAEMYEKFETETKDVDFLLSVIGSKPLKILEAACGGGRILIPLARAGHDAAGFDIDDCLLEKIGAKAEGLDNIVWYKADALEAAWGSGFDVVVLAGNILFNMVSKTDYTQAQRQMIQKAAGALAPGGHIYIDYQYSRHPELLFRSSGEMVIWEGTDSEGNSGRMFLTEQNFEEPTGMLSFVRNFDLTLKDGRRLQRELPSKKHYIGLEQLHDWLDSAGFVIEKEYGDYAGNPIGEKTNRAIIWAVKRDFQRK
ncbi:class I SAM-dependent methyltransferase [Eisenbergiella sp.]